MAFIYMRKYRLVMLLKSDFAKDRREKLFTDLKSWVGSPVSDESIKELGEKRLAYKIDNQQKGAYYLIEFGADTVAVDFEKRIGMQDNVLRHLLIRAK